MKLKFKNKGEVLLEYLKTIDGVVEYADNGVVQVDIANLPNKYAGLREHLDTVVSPYHVWHDLGREYEVSIPYIPQDYDDLVHIKIVKVDTNIVKLIDYLRLLAQEVDTPERDSVAVFHANVKNRIVKTFVDYLELQESPSIRVEWAVPIQD